MADQTSQPKIVRKPNYAPLIAAKKYSPIDGEDGIPMLLNVAVWMLIMAAVLVPFYLVVVRPNEQTVRRDAYSNKHGLPVQSISK